MNPGIDELANAVLKKPLHECSVDELQQLAQQYPYFGPVQLLLAKKLSVENIEQGNNSSLYEEQVQKTSLYFQNRVWLHYLLNDKSIRNPVTDHSTATDNEVSPVEHKEPDQIVESPVHETSEEEFVHSRYTEEIKEETQEQTETPAEMPETINQPIDQPINQHDEVQPLIEPAKEEITEHTESPVEMPATINQHDDQFTNQHEELPALNEPAKEEINEQAEAPFEMPALKIEPITTNTSLVFEPYHTVDYFASQGIKFKEDEKPKDRFSMQLKSFTEWLKTLKKAPGTENPTTTETPANNDAIGEKKVEQMAEYSLAERHVITEAMAEVWKKQGNKARAEDIYRKLSLLDPSKSSYFATKIEELKKTN